LVRAIACHVQSNSFPTLFKL